MAVFKCKMCGGDLSVSEGMKLITCDYCGTTQTVPNGDDEKKTNLFNRANRLRIVGEFDRAADIYETIVAEFPEESEAYWGLCLCKYGIEYVDDPRTARKIPTCHRTSFDSIFNDNNYKMALAHSDTTAHIVYENEANVIDMLQKNILSIVSQEKPFDVFICYKETDSLGGRTVDSVMAQDIYEYLTERGFKVFFARITLEDKLGKEYEPYIFAALNSAKVMLAIGTKPEYFESVWVKNEWSRYLSLSHDDRSKTLVPCYKDIDPYDMPAEFKNLQGQDMSKLGFIQDLTRGITKIVRGDADYSKTETVTGTITKRGYFFLEDGDFRSARKYFNKALDENPEDAKAYVGKVLSELCLSSINDLYDKSSSLTNNKDFERAIRFADGEFKIQLQEIKDFANKKIIAKDLCNVLDQIMKNKGTEWVLSQAKELSKSVTVESYNQIVNLYKNARVEKVNPEVFTTEAIASYERKANIISVLSDGNEYYFDEICRCKCFNSSYVSLSGLKNDIKQMLDDGVIEINPSNNKYSIADRNEIREQLMMEKNYSDAMSLMQSAIKNKNPKNCYLAADMFNKLGSYKDAQTMSEKCDGLGNGFKLEQRQAEEKKHQEIEQYNQRLQNQIFALEKEHKNQTNIYLQNANKLFGEGAKLKKAAKAEALRIEREIADLMKKLK